MTNKIIMVNTSMLEHHPDNPRKNIGDVTELADSIRAKGILQNLTVVPSGKADGKYYVVIGNRRLEASIAAGLEELPCVISDMDYKTQIETMMVENIQREDLTVVEQAEGMQLMLDLGSSVEEISEKTGFSSSTVRRRLKLNDYDKKNLVAAQDRGATLADFVKLEQIKTKPERNRLLKLMGTADFNLEFKRTIEEQENKAAKQAAIDEANKKIDELVKEKNASDEKLKEALKAAKVANADEDVMAIRFLFSDLQSTANKIISHLDNVRKKDEQQADMLGKALTGVLENLISQIATD